MLNELADKHGFELQRHCGFRLSVRDVPDDFRRTGHAKVRAARRHRERSFLDTTLIGLAAASLHDNPEQWSEWGEYGSIAKIALQTMGMFYGFQKEPYL
jgi:hypothetical protein